MLDDGNCSALPNDPTNSPCRASPEPSRSSRSIPIRNTSNYRGSIIDHVRCREFAYESKLERDFLEIVLARADVVDVEEQPPKVTYVTADGGVKDHWFDSRLLLRDGTRVAVDVKPRARVAQSGIEETQALIFEQFGTAFADIYIVRTEDHMHPDDVLDARLISRARRFADPAADEALTILLGHMHGLCRLGDVVDAIGSGAAAFNAAVRAIGAKILEVQEEKRISLDCMVRAIRP